jgi:hypothetical protein
VRLRKSNPKIGGNGHPLRIFNAWSHDKREDFYIDFDTICYFAPFPVLKKQDTENEGKAQRFSLIYKNSITSDPTQENCTLVSTKAGILPVLNSNITHRGTMLLAAVTFGNPLRTNARGPTRLWTIAHFPKIHSSGDIFHKESHTTTLPIFRQGPFCTGETVCESHVTPPEERQIPSILWRSGTTAIFSLIKPTT